MSVRSDDLQAVACPSCGGGLGFLGGRSGDLLLDGVLRCRKRGHEWPLREGVPQLVDRGNVRARDQFLRGIYDLIAPWHDLGVRFGLPILQLSGERSLREGYMHRLELDGLTRRSDGRPARILEVGIGAGANIPLIAGALPPGVEVELWGLDLSPDMLAQCERRVRRMRGWRVRLLLGDAHRLPFPDGTFDRVFHVGAIGGYADPAGALEEMGRVARPGTPIVVVDEQLATEPPPSLYHVLGFYALTAYDAHVSAPVSELPKSAYDVEVDQISRFYYCLRFRMPETGKEKTMAVSKVNEMLDRKDLTMLRDAYRRFDESDPEKLGVKKALTAGFPVVYARSADYVNAIGDAFYGPLPDDRAPDPREALSVRDRERCLIAVLAARDQKYNLAVHIYLGLANGISPEEIANILLLAGMYGGISTLSDGLAVEMKTLETLKTRLATGQAVEPPAVIAALRVVYPY